MIVSPSDDGCMIMRVTEGAWERGWGREAMATQRVSRLQKQMR
jgi:hypothetical protein